MSPIVQCTIGYYSSCVPQYISALVSVINITARSEITVAPAPDSSTENQNLNVKDQIIGFIFLTRTEVVDTVGTITRTTSACITTRLICLFPFKVSTVYTKHTHTHLYNLTPLSAMSSTFCVQLLTLNL